MKDIPMKIPNKIISTLTIRQDNDTSCFGCGPTYDRGRHNKRAKRLSSRRLRRIVKEASKVND